TRRRAACRHNARKQTGGIRGCLRILPRLTLPKGARLLPPPLPIRRRRHLVFQGSEQGGDVERRLTGHLGRRPESRDHVRGDGDSDEPGGNQWVPSPSGLSPGPAMAYRRHVVSFRARPVAAAAGASASTSLPPGLPAFAVCAGWGYRPASSSATLGPMDAEARLRWLLRTRYAPHPAPVLMAPVSQPKGNRPRGFTAAAQSRGGYVRAAGLSDLERAVIAMRGGRARWRGVTREERRTWGLRMVASRRARVPMMPYDRADPGPPMPCEVCGKQHEVAAFRRHPLQTHRSPTWRCQRHATAPASTYLCATVAWPPVARR